MTSEAWLKQAYFSCEKIARKNRPYLYLVARYFEDREKYRAFCSTYASMRIIDDKIDSIPFRGRMSAVNRIRFIQEVQGWLEEVVACQNKSSSPEPIFIALQDTFGKFPMPLFPWENLALAMQKDVGKDCFASFKEFINYAEGAAVAPATVFMFLLTAQRDGNGYIWHYPPKQIQAFARELALFCYLTHVIRDVASDLELGKSGLLYLSAQDLKRYRLNKEDLKEFQKSRRVNEGFRKLAAKYIERARSFEKRGRNLLQKLNPNLSKDSKFILDLLLEFYAQTLKKIAKVRYNVFSGKEKLTQTEENNLVRKVAKKWGVRVRDV